ncbi:MAG: DMT family transporter [Bacteroidota bacterium]
MRRLHADLALLLAALIWGGGFIFQKSAMGHIGPLLFIAARSVVAALALLPLVWREARNAATMTEGPARLVIAAGVAFFAGAWLQQEGLKTATVTNTGFLTALYVVITPFIAWVWAGKRPSAIVWPAIVLSGVGTWLLGGGTLEALSRGDILVALSSVMWAAHVVTCGHASRFGRPIGFTAAQFVVVALLGAIGAVCLEDIDRQALGRALPDIAYVGLLSSAVTFAILTVSLQHTSPSEAAVIVSTETLFAALAAYLLLGERLAGLGWIGAGLILVAALLVQIGPALMVATSGRAGGRTLLGSPPSPSINREK